MPAPADQPSSPDESALIAALRGRDPGAYERLLRDHGGRLLAVAARIMGNEHDAQDALQDGFLSAVRGIAGFDGKSKLSTWLHRIVVNACLMRLRARKRRPEESIEPLLPRFDNTGHRQEPGLAWNPAPESGIEREGLLRACRGAMAKLPDGYREVLVLRDVEGLNTEEAALVLEMTPGAVKTRLHRARQALRALLGPYMTGERDSRAGKGGRP
jgi:RNA polymerase sigma-70 factor (ECF subfamily)